MRVGRTLEQLLAHLEPRIKKILHMMSFSHTDITAALSDRVRLAPGNRENIVDSMRAFKSSPGWYLFQYRQGHCSLVVKTHIKIIICYLLILLINSVLFFSRLWNNIQPFESRPKVPPAALGHRKRCGDLRSTSAHKTSTYSQFQHWLSGVSAYVHAHASCHIQACVLYFCEKKSND